jgi:hypothetical protein
LLSPVRWEVKVDGAMTLGTNMIGTGDAAAVFSAASSSFPVISEVRSMGWPDRFVLAVEAIPPAVGCRTCGRWLYPDRVEVVHDHGCDGESADRRGTVLVLTCPRCHAWGTLARVERVTPATNELLAQLTRQANCADCRV